MDQSEWTNQIAVGFLQCSHVKFCNLIGPLGVDSYDQ